MRRLRELYKNDFIVALLAVFISWPCCNGFRIELEKKSCHSANDTAFVAGSHVMGTACGQDGQGSPLRILQTSIVVFDFQKLFRIQDHRSAHPYYSYYQSLTWNSIPKELLFSKLLI